MGGLGSVLLVIGTIGTIGTKVLVFVLISTNQRLEATELHPVSHENRKKVAPKALFRLFANYARVELPRR